MYQGHVRYNVAWGFDFYDKKVTAAGWTDNYDNYIDFQTTGNNNRLYRIRLVGEMQPTFFTLTAGGIWVRHYSSSFWDAALSNKGVFSKTDLGEYKITKTGEQLTIVKSGIKYISTATPVLDGQSKYLRIARVESPNKILTLTYDADLNMTTVADNRGHTLQFTRAYKESLLALTQTLDEKTVITKVELARANDTLAKQSVSYSYTVFANLDPNLNSNKVFVLTGLVSTVGGSKTYSYTKIMQPWVNMFLRGQNNANVLPNTGIGFANLYVPVLTKVQDEGNNVLTQLDITQNYTYSPNTDGVFNSLDFGQATSTIEGYALIGTTKYNLSKTEYNDKTGLATYSAKPNGVDSVGFSGSTSTTVTNVTTTLNGASFTYQDDSKSTLTFSSLTKYPAVLVDKFNPLSISNDSYYSRLDGYTTHRGLGVVYTYDALNRITMVKQTAGLAIKTTTYQYTTLSDNITPNTYNIPNIVTYPEGKTITNTIDLTGNVTQTVEASTQVGSVSKTTKYVYYTDPALTNYGLLKSVTGPRSTVVGATLDDTVTYTYDNWGNVTTEVRKATDFSTNTVTTLTTTYTGYNNAGQPEYMVQPDGKVTKYDYDTRFRKTKEEYGTWNTATNSFATVLTTQTWSYNTLNQLTQQCDADNKCVTYTYDSLGRASRTTQPSGNYSETTYHLNGQVQSTVQKSAAGIVMLQSTTTLDANGRVLRSHKGTDATRNWVDSNYDIDGNVTKTTTALNIINSWVYDPFGRVTSHTDGMNFTNSREYDLLDNVKTATAPNAQPFNFTYKNGGVVKTDQTNSLLLKDYSHDLADNVTEWAQGANRNCVMANYNQQNLLHSRNCTQSANADLQVAEGYTYDHLRNLLLSVDTSVSNVSSAKGVKTNYTYDALNRVASKSQLNKTIKTLGLSTVDKALTTSYTYSAAGRLNSITYPSTNAVTYTYDIAGRVSGVKWGTTDVLSAISYDGSDRMTGWAWGLPTSTDKQVMTYDGAGQLMVNSYYEGTSRVASHDIESRDADGRIITIRGAPNQLVAQYDFNGRLTRWSNNSSQTVKYNRTYVYDSNGNRTSSVYTVTTGTTPVSTTTSYGHGAGVGVNTNNILTTTTGKTLSTGAYGELFDAAYGTPAYDAIGRRKTDTNLGATLTALFDYNHANLRTYKRVGTAAGRQFVYDDANHLIGEYSDAGAPVNEYIYLGDKPVAVVYKGVVYRIITDHNNTPRLIKKPGVAAIWSWRPLDAFGENTASISTGLWVPAGFEFNLRFPGMYADSHNGLFYNHNRYYNPSLGRYMEPDPIGLQGGLNPYVYADNNPVMNVDPDGLSPVNINYRPLVLNNGAPPSMGYAPQNINLTRTWDLVTDRRIAQLDPRVRGPATNFINQAQEQLGVNLRVTQSYRTFAEQDKLYAQGRTSPGDKVTPAKGGQSYHNYRLAIDVVIMRNSQPVWDRITPRIAAIGIENGFKWGGYFKRPDYPHFEMSFGQTVKQLYNQRGK